MNNNVTSDSLPNRIKKTLPPSLKFNLSQKTWMQINIFIFTKDEKRNKGSTVLLNSFV